MQVREKVRKSRNTVFFQWFVAPEARKVGSLKRRVRSQLARWEMKNCMPLWREAHFEVKMYKTHQLRTTLGSCDVEKVHAVVARSTFPSQNVQSTPGSEHFWKLRCRKSARRCGVKHISKSKCTKHFISGALLEVEMSKKCTPLWREAHFEGTMLKTPRPRTTFWHSDVVLRGRRKGLCTFSKVSKTWGFCSISKNDGRRGTFEEDLQRCTSRGRRSTKDMFLRGVAFWSIRSSGLLRWFCVTGAALRMTWHLFFVAGAVLQTGGVEKSQNAMARGRQLCTQLSIFEGSLAELLRFWCCQLKNWGSLAGLFCFRRCQVQIFRKSRRIALFLMLSSSKIEEVSQNSFVFKLADRQIDG